MTISVSITRYIYIRTPLDPMEYPTYSTESRCQKQNSNISIKSFLAIPELDSSADPESSSRWRLDLRALNRSSPLIHEPAGSLRLLKVVEDGGVFARRNSAGKIMAVGSMKSAVTIVICACAGSSFCVGRNEGDRYQYYPGTWCDAYLRDTW